MELAGTPSLTAHVTAHGSWGGHFRGGQGAGGCGGAQLCCSLGPAGAFCGRRLQSLSPFLLLVFPPVVSFTPCSRADSIQEECVRKYTENTHTHTHTRFLTQTHTHARTHTHTHSCLFGYAIWWLHQVVEACAYWNYNSSLTPSLHHTQYLGAHCSRLP